MRRTRNRYLTIDAQNEEEYIKEYEKMKKSRLSELNFKQNLSNNTNQIIESPEENTSAKKTKQSLKLSNSDSEDSTNELGLGGLGVHKDLDEDEDNLGQIYEDDDILRGEEGMIKNQYQNIEEKGLEMLCYYLKNSVKELSMEKGNESIFFNIKNKNKNVINALSGNAIYDLNIRDLVDNILSENDNEYNKINEGNNNSLKDFIFQNIESDSTLKIMIMSNNKSTKNSFIKSFFNKEEDNFDTPFEIRKKQVKIFNKNISLQIFDTSDEFHKNSLSPSSIYYNKASAFFIFIEASKNNSKNYLDFIYEKINKYINNKTCVIFGINMLFKEDCTIEGNNLREYASEKNMMFIPIKFNEFNMKNNLILNLFKLILIKRIDNKVISQDSIRKEKNERKLGGIQNKLADKIKDSSQKKDKYDITKMNIESSLGYRKKYRIKHINAFDIKEDDFSNKNKRKLSADI